jgi:hypothetical protein
VIGAAECKYLKIGISVLSIAQKSDFFIRLSADIRMAHEQGFVPSGNELKARRVFGESIVDESDSSLTYSPSPHRHVTFGSDCEDIDKGHSLHEEISAPRIEKENKTTEVLQNVFPSNTMRERVRNMRMMSRSPLRRDLVKKTQDAINKAAVSLSNINKSVLSGQNSQLVAHDRKRQVVLKTHQNWRNDANEAKTLAELTEQNRREFLSLQRHLSSKFSKEKARREQILRRENLNRIEKEIHFKSDVFRDHKSKLKQEENERRRHSVAARAKIRSNHRIGTQNLKMTRFQEEQAIFEERHAASVALRDTLNYNSKQRRQSFAFRNGDARRIRQLHAAMEQERLQKEHKSFELKWQAQKDAEEYKLEMARVRRESLAHRNAEGRTQRNMAAEAQKSASSAEHVSYELKWAAEKDAEAYSRSQQEDRRLSLMQRNQEGKRQRNFQQQQNADMLLSDHASFELKWAGERDAKFYQNEQDKLRRESFAFRNTEGRRLREFETMERSQTLRLEHERLELKWTGEKDAESYQREMEAERRESLRFRNQERLQHAKVLEELRLLALEKETESYVLKWAGQNDAKTYVAELEKEKRRSLQLRGKQIIHLRQVESEQYQSFIRQLHEDEALRATDHRNAEQFAKECAERDRKSFEFRRKDARKQRIEEEERSVQRQEIEDRNTKLETLARKDVAVYVDDCKKRRRMSLACRAKEKRNHAKWMLQQKEKEQHEQSRRVHDQLIDKKYVELALQKERACLALNAIRHAGYSAAAFTGGKL